MSDRGLPARVEVIYARPERQWIISLPLVARMTALQAVRESGLLERFPEIGAVPLVLGIFGVEVEQSARLQAGDRVEICRPLREDPRMMRRRLAASGEGRR